MNFQPLKDFLDYYLPMLGVPGSDTVIYKDHKEIFRYQSGFDSLRFRSPVRPDALYNIYSCTRVATVVAVMQLIERGEILVTDPLYAFIPEFREARVAVKDEKGNIIDTRAANAPITVKHLLTMTSGINYNHESQAISDVVSATLGKAPTLDICRAIASEPLEADPGERYVNGFSHDILGGVIELVSGMRLSEYMEKNIFQPLGMKDTAFHIATSNFARLASQYDYDKDSREIKDIPAHICRYRFGTEYDSAGEGLVSTAEDFVLLADALANGGVGKSGYRIISEYALDLMSRNMLSGESLLEFAKGHNTGYGFGYGIRVNTDPTEIGNLAPIGEMSQDGESLCYFSADRKSRVAVFHAEHMGGLHQVVIPRLRNLIYSSIGRF